MPLTQEVLELVYKATNEAVLATLQARLQANAAAVDALQRELDDAVVSETEFRKASEKLFTEKVKLEKQIDEVTASLKTEAAAARVAGEALEAVGPAASNTANRVQGLANAFVQLGVLYDDIQYGSKNIANNLFAIGMMTPEPRLRVLITTVGFLTAAFHEQIDAGLAWAGILNENVAKGLKDVDDATGKHAETLALLKERLEAAGEATRKLDDAEKERRENIRKALEQQSKAQQGTVEDAQGVMQQLGGKRFEEFVKALATRDVGANMDPKSPFGQGEVARRSLAMMGGVAGGESGQAALMLALMQRNPAILQQFGVAMPVPRPVGADAGGQTEAARQAAAAEEERRKIREQLDREEREAKEKADREAEQARRRAERDARQAEEDRYAAASAGFSPAMEATAAARMDAGEAPDAVAADLMQQAERAGASTSDAFRMAGEAVMEAMRQQTEAARQFALQMGEAMRQQQQEIARAQQQALQATHVGRRSIRQQNAMNAWNNNRPGWP